MTAEKEVEQPTQILYFEVYQNLDETFGASFNVVVKNNSDHFIAIEMMANALNKMITNFGKNFHDSQIETKKEYHKVTGDFKNEI